MWSTATRWLGDFPPAASLALFGSGARGHATPPLTDRVGACACSLFVATGVAAIGTEEVNDRRQMPDGVREALSCEAVTKARNPLSAASRWPDDDPQSVCLRLSATGLALVANSPAPLRVACCTLGPPRCAACVNCSRRLFSERTRQTKLVGFRSPVRRLNSAGAFFDRHFAVSKVDAAVGRRRNQSSASS